MADLITCKIFEGLVQRFGGVEAVAALLEARTGTGSKGTISKICAGQLSVPVEMAVALEDALGSYPITKRMAARLEGGAPKMPSRATLQEMAARASLEHADVMNVILRAFSPASADPTSLTEIEKTAALKELYEARGALDAMIVTIERGGE